MAGTSESESSSSSSADEKKKRKKKQKHRHRRHKRSRLDRLEHAVKSLTSAFARSRSVSSQLRSGSTSQRARSSSSSDSSQLSNHSGDGSEARNRVDRSTTNVVADGGDGQVKSGTQYETPADPHTVEEGDALVISVLDQETKDLLGDTPCTDDPKGPDLHAELATRWSAIAQKGLKKDEREKITKSFPFPGNCSIGGARLNPELKQVVPSYTRDRDDTLYRAQQNVGISAVAVGNVLTSLLDKSQTIDRKQLIVQINEAGRFLVNTQYSLSMYRRKQVLANVKDVGMKELLYDAPLYPNLFGSDLGAKVKAAQTVAKTGHDITRPQIMKAEIRPRQPDRRVETPKYRNRSTRSTNQSYTPKNLNSNRPLPMLSKSQNYGSGRRHRQRQ